MPKQRKSPPYNVDQLIEIIDQSKLTDLVDMFASVIYAIKDLEESLDRLDNEFRDYNP